MENIRSQFKISQISKLLLFIIGLWLIILASSCSLEKRCSRVKGRHPECFETLLTQVELVRIDTLYKSYAVVDTVFRLNTADTSRIDTFFVYSPKVITRIIHRRDTLSVTSTVLPDTIYKTYTKTIQGVAIRETYIPFWIYAIIGLLVLLVLVIICKRIIG